VIVPAATRVLVSACKAHGINQMRERKVAGCSRVQPVEVRALLAEIRFVEFIEI
jgi:hypothetical protein